jgi:hypothetical protein
VRLDRDSDSDGLGGAGSWPGDGALVGPAGPGTLDEEDDDDRDHRHQDHENEYPQAVMAVVAAEEARAQSSHESGTHQVLWLLV